MPEHFPEVPRDGDPTAAEIFRVFRNTTMATIVGLKTLLDECADLRAELVTIVDGNHGGSQVFSARQENYIQELRQGAQAMEALLASLPDERWSGDGEG
jgi:hypothetical protein